MNSHADAYGQEIDAYRRSECDYEVVEREDGYIDACAGGPAVYFSEYEQWPASHKKAMAYASGRALDIGCGAGRHSLYLQSRGCDVLGIDLSPLAVETCRARGLKRVDQLSITQVTPALGTFDTILMMGNNFGLFGGFKRARWLLKRFYRMTSPQALIIAESRDPYQTAEPEHLAYHEYNRKRGRMSGQVRIRIRHKKSIGPWFDYLLVSREEMQSILRGTGWEVQEFIEGGNGMYIAVIGKEGMEEGASDLS